MIDLLEVVAESTRRKILHLLSKNELTVTDIANEFEISRSAISQQLLLLEQAGLVDARKVGRNRLYKVNPKGMLKVRQFFLDEFWSNEIDLLVADAQKYLAKKERKK